jgi:hypothetical protein
VRPAAAGDATTFLCPISLVPAMLEVQAFGLPNLHAITCRFRLCRAQPARRVSHQRGSERRLMVEVLRRTGYCLLAG